MRRSYAVNTYIIILSNNSTKFPKNFWMDKANGIYNYEYAKEIMKYLFEEYLKWDDEQIKNNLSSELFTKYKLKGMLATLFDASPYLAINFLYPNRFREWEFKNSKRNFWDMETSQDAIKWLIEVKLKWTDEDIKKNLSKETFRENGLGSLLSNLFCNSPFLAINHAYPGRFFEWELNNVPRNFWNLEKAREATIWLVEKRLKLTDEQIPLVTKKSFRNNHLGSMLSQLFNNNVSAALRNAYPEKSYLLI